MPNVVFDTVVFVRGLINPVGHWGRLVFDRAGEYRLVVSSPVVAEIVEVITRPRVAALFRSLPSRDPQRVVEVLSQAMMVTLGAVPRISRDPKDDVFLATAATGGADFLVSEDQDLLVLGTYAGVRIVDARAFLAALDAIAGA